MHYSFRQK